MMTKIFSTFIYITLLALSISYSATSKSQEATWQAEPQVMSDEELTKNSIKIEELRKAEEQANESEAGQKLRSDALIKASEEMDRLEAQIEKAPDNFQKRPKRRFIGARAKNAQDALYMGAWRQKVEQVGNLHYPKAAKEQHIYGKVRATVSIMANGELESIAIDKSSGHKILDDAVVEIVKLAAPYAEFSDEMKKNTDILGITRTWTFTHEEVIDNSESSNSTLKEAEDLMKEIKSSK